MNNAKLLTKGVSVSNVNRLKKWDILANRPDTKAISRALAPKTTFSSVARCVGKR
jgi:hypothetical protein